MIQIKLEHGNVLGVNSIYEIKVTVSDTESMGSTDVTCSISGLDRLSKTKLKELFERLERSIHIGIKVHYADYIPTIEEPKVNTDKKKG
jgi:hypothetical protein